MQIVWFKRDLRVFDNEAFKKACETGPILPLYIFEKDLWKNSPMCMKHYTFLKRPVLVYDNYLFIGNSSKVTIKMKKFLSEQ